MMLKCDCGHEGNIGEFKPTMNKGFTGYGKWWKEAVDVECPVCGRFTTIYSYTESWTK